jgi:hypothetical protein
MKLKKTGGFTVMTNFSFHAWCPHTGYGISCQTREEAEALQREINESMMPAAAKSAAQK